MALTVSIITPAFNASETIEDTLKSIMAQTHPYWEAIVVNDGSTDQTAAIVRSFVEQDSRIRLIEKSQSGISAARNSALAIARNDWLLFLDADDWISPAYLTTLTDEIVRHPELDAVFCRSFRVAGDGTLVPETYIPPSGDLFSILAYRAAFPLSACIVRKSLVDAVGRFDISHKRSVDWDLWQRVARTGARFGAVPETLAYYRMSPRAATLDACQMFRDGLEIIRQGHAVDTRVPNPHPDHAFGEPPELILKQVFYLLSWCAGILLGSERDTKPLMELVQGYQNPELYPDAVAQCIFDAAPLPNCLPPAKWEELGPRILPRIDEFFIDLERQSLATGLARCASSKLRTMILEQSPSWSPIFHEYEEQIQRQTHKRLAELEGNEQRIARYDEREKMLIHFEKQFWFRLGWRLNLLKGPRKYYSGKRLTNYLEFFKRRFSRLVAITAILVSVLYAILYQLAMISRGGWVTFGFALAAVELIIATEFLIKPRLRFLAPTLLLLGAEVAVLIFTS